MKYLAAAASRGLIFICGGSLLFAAQEFVLHGLLVARFYRSLFLIGFGCYRIVEATVNDSSVNIVGRIYIFASSERKCTIEIII